MIVVDATVWVDLLLGDLPAAAADLLLGDLCISPPHVDFEVGSALVRAERRDAVSAGSADRLIRAFTSTPCRREYDATDPVRALRFRDNATYADAWYLAMASRLACPVVTTDSGMSAAADAHGVEVVGP
ncbi:MAG: type II toxin-antitoxin system VapC family toxin [Kineosporiaceae bacterium]